MKYPLINNCLFCKEKLIVSTGYNSAYPKKLCKCNAGFSIRMINSGMLNVSEEIYFKLNNKTFVYSNYWADNYELYYNEEAGYYKGSAREDIDLVTLDLRDDLSDLKEKLEFYFTFL